MYEELVKRLRSANTVVFRVRDLTLMQEAADAIEELSAKVGSLQIYMDNISKLPDCNTCFKKTNCDFRPNYGEYCRINCPAWLGVPERKQEVVQNDS